MAQIDIINLATQLAMEHGWIVPLLIYFIWKDHTGKVGLVRKIEEYERFVRDVMTGQIRESIELMAVIRDRLATDSAGHEASE